MFRLTLALILATRQLRQHERHLAHSSSNGGRRSKSCRLSGSGNISGSARHVWVPGRPCMKGLREVAQKWQALTLLVWIVHLLQLWFKTLSKQNAPILHDWNNRRGWYFFLAKDNTANSHCTRWSCGYSSPETTTFIVMQCEMILTSSRPATQEPTPFNDFYMTPTLAVAKTTKVFLWHRRSSPQIGNSWWVGERRWRQFYPFKAQRLLSWAYFWCNLGIG